MYAKLKGKVSDIFDNYIVIDVHDVGYKVEGISDVLEGQEINVYIYTYVREQEIRLFGFKNKQELVLFEKLLNVQGVGPKIAVKLINSIDIDVIVNSIIEDDYKSLKVPGLGEKLSKQIILDLKGKINESFGSIGGQVGAKLADKSKNDEIVQALVVLGYNQEKVAKFSNDHAAELLPLSVQDKIKYILKYINK